MNDDMRVHQAQTKIREVAAVLTDQQAGLDEAADLVDDPVHDAMLTWEACPTLAHALHGRLATAREELDELLITLAAAARMRREDVEERWRALHRP